MPKQLRHRIALVIALVAAGVLLWFLRGTRIGNPVTFAERLERSETSPYRLTTEPALRTQDRQRLINELFDRERDGYFTGAQGVHIRYRVFAQPAAEEKAAVVISSGRTESIEIYKELIYDLHQQKYSVYIHDHRGQGASDRLYLDDIGRGHVDNFDFYVDDLHTFVQQVVLPATHKRVFLLAHSMGGGIATRYIERYHDGIHAVALVTPMNGPLVKLAGLDLSRPLCAASETFVASAILSPAEFGLGEHDWRPTAFGDNDLTHSPERFTAKQQTPNKIGGVTHGWFRQACRAGELTRTEAEHFDIPVLVLQAGGDTAVSNRAQQDFCDRVNRVEKGRCLGYALSDAYHAVLLEQDDLRTPALTKVLDFFGRNT